LNLAHRGLLVAIPVTLLLSHRDMKVPRYVGRLLVGAWVGVVWGLVTTMLNGSSLEGALLLFQNVAPFAFLLGVASASRAADTRIAVMRAVFWLGAVLATQTVVLFALFALHRVPGSTTVVLSGTRSLAERNYGVLGFGNNVLGFGREFAVYRAQSWFGEPSSMACFLEAALGFGLVTMRRAEHPRLHRAGLYVMVASLFFTFSTAMQFAAGATAMLLTLGRFARRFDNTTRLLVSVVALVLGATLIPPALDALNNFYSHRASRINIALGKSAFDTGTRTRASRETLDFIASHPQGAGFAPLPTVEATHERVSEPPSSAPMYWGLVEGVPGLLFAFAFFLSALAALVIPAVGTRNRTLRILGAALVAQLIHQVSAGAWTFGAFLLTLALLSWELVGSSERNR
jgi:hypothetical protein